MLRLHESIDDVDDSLELGRNERRWIIQAVSQAVSGGCVVTKLSRVKELRNQYRRMCSHKKRASPKEPNLLSLIDHGCED